MRINFDKSAKFVLKQEVEPGHEEDGSLHTDPKDPGGTTRFGISQRAYPSIDLTKINKEQALKIYLERWVANGCDDLTWPLDIIHFDTDFNMGSKAAKSLLDKFGQDSGTYLMGRLAVYWNIYKRRKNAQHLSDWLKRIINLYFFILEQ